MVSVTDRICSLRIWSEEKLSKIMPKQESFVEDMEYQ